MTRYWLHRQIAERKGILPATFYNRISRGWSPLRAATTPPRPYFYEWYPS